MDCRFQKFKDIISEIGANGSVFISCAFTLNALDYGLTLNANCCFADCQNEISFGYLPHVVVLWNVWEYYYRFGKIGTETFLDSH